MGAVNINCFSYDMHGLHALLSSIYQLNRECNANTYVSSFFTGNKTIKVSVA